MIIWFILVFVLLVSIMVYFHIEDKRELKRYEEEKRKRDDEWKEHIHKYTTDSEYRKKYDKEQEDKLKHYNSDYHTWNDPYYTSDIPHTTYPSRHDDPFNDITSPCCPYGIWTWG